MIRRYRLEDVAGDFLTLSPLKPLHGRPVAFLAVTETGLDDNGDPVLVHHLETDQTIPNHILSRGLRDLAGLLAALQRKPQ